ncbi:MAG: alpha/beta hydrolase [Isosphaeraceae bacterium]|nr:alpha/beta hydrolase [Isosphaeraceae bacterium]
MLPKSLHERSAPIAGGSGPPPEAPAAVPADFGAEVAAYDRAATVGVWEGPRYRMTYRVLGQGPPLVLVPGIAATYRVFALLLNRLAEHFQTVIYSYPGDYPDDGARLDRITHSYLVADLFGLLDHLGLGPVFLFGPSFGSTITLRALDRAPERCPAAVLQGGFARRRFRLGERLALLFGRRFAGRTLSRVPLHDAVLVRRQRIEFPAALADRWDHFVRENGLTPMAALAHRLDLVSQLDLRPLLPAIRAEVLLLQGDQDRLVPRPHYDELLAGLPHARGMILPGIGHLPHYTHPEELARWIADFLLLRTLSTPAEGKKKPGLGAGL